MGKRRSVKWNIVLLGFVVFGVGIMIILFSDKGDDQFTAIDPIGFILIIASIIVTGWGFRIRSPQFP